MRAAHFLVLAACTCACSMVSAQYGEGPLPPRLQIPGAIPVSGGPPQRTVVRQRRPQSLGPQARQQAYLPTPTHNAPTPPSVPRPVPQTTLPPRPVEEEPEEYDDEEPQSQVTSLPVSPAPVPPPVFRTARPQIRQNDIPSQFRQPAQPARLPQRPQAQVSRPIIPEAQIATNRQQQQFRPQPVRPVPVFRPERPVIAPENTQAVAENVQRDYNRQQPRPEQQQLVRQPQRPAGQEPRYKPQRANQKPVAQVLNRYREDNPDGSITWGYENDDGSFKEETIGANCIVSGKYGYIDPDGVTREYTYSSGILCDKTKEAEQEQEQGYMDYQNNEYVLPNGQSVDLQSFSKNKSRRPVPNYGK